MRIGLISDTHSFIDEQIISLLKDCDQIWHAGDIGDPIVAERLSEISVLKAVYGNIDGPEIRQSYPEHQIFEIESKKIWMTHIGSYPPKYNTSIRKQIEIIRPDIFVCGHSHILKVIPDKKLNLLHMNPGAAGHHGFHKIRTLLRFSIEKGNIHSMEAVELGKRGKIKP
ncbi:metallophosphoesterase family protein [Hyphobacterium sp. CCMP332]|nr:metallophosphoesterase family protein [Hyphobacterium sp. CCMP332]